jgi:hypothetical protein
VAPRRVCRRGLQHELRQRKSAPGETLPALPARPAVGHPAVADLRGDVRRMDNYAWPPTSGIAFSSCIASMEASRMCGHSRAGLKGAAGVLFRVRRRRPSPEIASTMPRHPEQGRRRFLILMRCPAAPASAGCNGASCVPQLRSRLLAGLYDVVLDRANEMGPGQTPATRKWPIRCFSSHAARKISRGDGSRVPTTTTCRATTTVCNLRDHSPLVVDLLGDLAPRLPGFHSRTNSFRSRLVMRS